VFYNVLLMIQSYAAFLSSSSTGNKSKATNGEEALSSSIAIKKSKVTKATKTLEALHNEKSLTQREIAQRVGCHEQYVSQVKRAENTTLTTAL